MDMTHTFTAARMHAQGSITYNTPVGADYATATVTIVDYSQLSGVVVSVDGNDLTEGVGWNAATDNDTTATSLASAINGISGVGAAAGGAEITITNDARGTAGNSKALTSTDETNLTLSGATLSGGVDGDTVVVNGTTCTCVVGTAGANEFSSITELEVLTEAIADINSSEDGTTVTINADAVGTAGNSITLALGGSNAGDMAISGATLTGGAAALYTNPFDLPDGFDEVDIILTATALTGGSPTVDAVPEGSYDGGTTYRTLEDKSENQLAFTQLIAAGNDQQYCPLAAPRVRVKVTLGGTSPVLTGTVRFFARD